ncbi:MAG: pilus assembly protein N-terminal domain-containing protein [Bosea sp. (in: a-proteobacteria)]
MAQQNSARASAAATSPASMETVSVALDHARVVKLPERTSTVIIGNPIIADVAVQKNGILVVTGKSYGQTNLIALDSNGQMLAESQISVRQSLETIMTVQRGLDRESYSCTPHCQRAIQLGDAPKFFGDTSGQANARNSQATAGK